ncbi:MAG: peptidase M16 [Gammaproteobacteria bacterium]|nr:MAG: peptidase M16 [Gammaproteobacteria bacterium]
MNAPANTLAHPAFEHLRSTPIDSLKITVEEYRHRVTGASHLHLAADNNENVFMVAFRTVPMDSTGVAHILEHTSLCGSARYPVRDPFFMMLRRSLNTFMNAFTSSDWTAYPFASQNRKDFDNLLKVYLDAAFFPKLDALDFAQEGHRVEFTEADNPDTPLVFRGVVFNEMKGAMSSPTSQLWHRLCHHLFPASTYHYNSGGEPADIPDLSWQQLRDFHATHYHPSNAMFMTFGDIPAQQHQQAFESLALSQFKSPGKTLTVSNETRLEKPLRVTEPYPVDEQGDEPKSHVVTAWLLGESASLDDALEAQLLINLLMDNSASPLMAALETSDLGNAPSPICGLEDSMKEMVFVAGLQGCADNSVDAVEALVLNTLEHVERTGFSPEAIESVLHQLEFHRREIGGDGYPYGLQLLLNALTSVNHQGDPVAMLDIDPALARLRQSCEDPKFPVQLLRKWLLGNPHRVTLHLQPDTGMSAREQAAEKARLHAIESTLDDAARQQLVALADALKQRQEQQDDPDILPRVTLADVPSDIPVLEEQAGSIGKAPLSRFAVGTNGLCYAQCLLALPPDLSADDLDLLPLYTRILTEVGVGAQDYLAIQQRQSLHCGGFHASTQIRTALDDIGQTRGYLVLSGKALQRNRRAMLELMQETLARVRFDEHDRIRDLIAQTRSGRENSITSQGHSLAMLAASAAVNPHAWLQHRMGGLASLPFLKQLDQSLADDAIMSRFSQQLQQLHQRCLQQGQRFLLVSEPDSLEAATAELQQAFANSRADTARWMASPSASAIGNTGWTTRTDVNFCASAYPTVMASHADSPALTVLAGVLRNGYLHRAIREQGGAYGGGASHDTATGTFRFFSYRDPRLADTYADFDAAIHWAANTAHDARTVEEAILGVIASLDRPASPAGEAKSQYYQSLFGRDLAFRKAFRAGVLATTTQDLQRVASQYLLGKTPAVAAITNQQRASEIPATDVRLTAI